MGKIEISIVMPVYNGEKFIAETIESLLNQTFKNFELLIINDNSTDNTESIISNYLEKDERIILLQNQFDKGVVGALNTGLKSVKAEYIAIANADDIHRDYKLMLEYNFLKKHKKIYIVGGGYTPFNENGHRINIFHPQSSIEIALKFIFNSYFCNPTIMFRKEIIEKIGYYKKESSEDYAYSSEIIKYFRPANIKKILIDYREHPQNLSKTIKNEIEECVGNISKKNYEYFYGNITGYEDYKDYVLNNNIKNYKIIIRINKIILRKIKDIYKLSFLDLSYLYFKYKPSLILIKLKRQSMIGILNKTKNIFKKIIKKFLSFLNLKIEKINNNDQGKNNYLLLEIKNLKREKLELKNNFNILSLFYNSLIHNQEKNNSLECIIFSMDRAFQLHSLLGSIIDNLKPIIPINIIYRTSNKNHQIAYDEVFQIYKNLNLKIIKQNDKNTFKVQLLEILKRIESENIFFLVDDNLFIEDINIKELMNIDTRIFVPSLRLGKNLKKCYTMQKDQELPKFISKEKLDKNLIQIKDMLIWDWGNGFYDWGYPLSVDGNIFLKNEILQLSKIIDFDSPNTYESNLQVFNEIYKLKIGLCYNKSKLVNLPINKVQTDIPNIYGNIHQEELLNYWNNGYQMDYKALYRFNNESAHQEIKFNFIKR